MIFLSKRIPFFILLIAVGNQLTAQDSLATDIPIDSTELQYTEEEDNYVYMLNWNASWDDVLYEWDIVYEKNFEEDQGEVEATWSHVEDWSQWDYMIDDHIGTIWRKWDNRDDEWELRSDHNVVRIRTRWMNDFSEWKIQYNNEIEIIWRAESFNDGNVWSFDNRDYGVYEFYTEYVDDPRDWLIYDDTTLGFPIEIKIACCFIAMYRSTVPFR